MNPLNVIRGFDPELYEFFEEELEQQRFSLSFIPDENSTSPLSAALMGSVLINANRSPIFKRNQGIESLTCKRLCQIFGAQNANIRTLTIEAASRVVFQAVARRGDVVMSLDLRKKEHCNSENMVYRFVNFGLDPDTQRLDMDKIEAQARACKPQLIICSPINYPHTIDYARFAEIAHEVGAVLWCDISQVAGLVASGHYPSPAPYADVVTFTGNGSLQGPQSAIILSTDEYANAIDRMTVSSGHFTLQTALIASLAARIHEMRENEFKKYGQSVVDNAKALAEGLSEGGLRLIGDGTDTHLIVVDAKSCALSARGAQELLAGACIMVRICTVMTADPAVKYDAIRFSTLPATTRGISTAQLKDLGLKIAKFLQNPSDAMSKELYELVMRITVSLPLFYGEWLAPVVRHNLVNLSLLSSDSSIICDSSHPSRLALLSRKVSEYSSRKK